ncbi:MAG: hypothetical protein ACTSSF_00265 [Candidatus Heimdallarchaeaceae archaeon]
MKWPKYKYKHKAHTDALLSLQFHRDGNGRPIFSITSNLNSRRHLDNSFTQLSYQKFGRDLAQVDFLSEQDKFTLELFCQSYLECRKQMKDKEDKQ